MGIDLQCVIAQNLLLKATNDGWVVKIVDFGLSNTHEVNTGPLPCRNAPARINKVVFIVATRAGSYW
jgi:hypothetical protein